MIIVPNQQWGIGDVIFTQTLVHEIAQGEQVIWPVLPEFVDGLNRAYPTFKFVDCYKEPIIDTNRRGEYYWNGYRVLPLRFAQEMRKRPYCEVMRAKYDLYGLDWRRWKEKATFQRDLDKEWDLLMKTDFKPDIRYNLINNIFQSDTKGKLNIHPNNDYQNIYMNIVDDYSLFDWCTLIENAAEIHTVSTSIVYLFELLDLDMPIHIYPRIPIEPTLENIDYILEKKNYILHG